eukprot:TRINITY_DN2390_c0_g3_i2.p1 TRINITY_DN2390_c0_g3~~TRINITY_DN2390_c0_g3_i2.p1  ORF type:complete len:469 (+),score=75.33 TRINITY_DN2390_c0_g3_i2:116-1522(+)
MSDREAVHGVSRGQTSSHFPPQNLQLQAQQAEISLKQKQQHLHVGMQPKSQVSTATGLSPKAEKLVLKLDDGSIVGSAGRLGVGSKSPSQVVKLNVEQALEKGRLGSKDAKRLYDILQQLPGTDPLEQTAQNAGNMLSNSNKRKKPPEMDEMLSQRPRSSQPTQLQPSQVHTHTVQETQEDVRIWHRKCENILKGVQKSLGPNVHIFNVPVNAQQVPDYYNIVKNPMDLGTIARKLKEGQYSSPLGFLEDMRLVWSNCKLYNGISSPVGAMGYNAGRKFEDLWAQSGLEEGLRARRTTAGVAANRFDPDEGMDLGNTTSTKSKPKSTGNPTSRSKTSQQQAIQRHRKQQQEANSEPQGQPSTEVMQEVLGVLQEMVMKNDDALQVVIEIIRSGSPNAVPADQVDEFELDMEVLDAKTIWKLYNFVKKIKQKKANQREQVTSKGARVQDSDSGSSMDSDDGDEESDDGE